MNITVKLTLRYIIRSSVWSPNSYLLQCFQALVHFQGISQCSGSLRSNLIVVETVQEKSIIIHVRKLSCDNDLFLIVIFSQSGVYISVRQLQGSVSQPYTRCTIQCMPSVHLINLWTDTCILLLVGVACAFQWSAMCNKVWAVWEGCQSVCLRKWARFRTPHQTSRPCLPTRHC